jgi:glycosyltransferase involved in cell wall biosynthesis
VKHTYRGLKLLLVGDGILREQLHSTVRSLGLQDTVIFCGNQENVAAFIDLSEFTVLASLAEGLPLTIIESLVLGKAVVATRVGGVPEVVNDGESGLLVPARNVPALSSALMYMLGNPEKATAMGRRGQEEAIKRFRRETMFQQYSAYYERLLARQRASGGSL